MGGGDGMVIMMVSQWLKYKLVNHNEDTNADKHTAHLEQLRSTMQFNNANLVNYTIVVNNSSYISIQI